MNNRGMSNGFMFIFVLIILSMVLVGMYRQANNVDMDYVHSVIVSKDLLFTTSFISFIPGNFLYSYLTDDESYWSGWNFYMKFKKSKIEPFEDSSSENYFKFLSANKEYSGQISGGKEFENGLEVIKIKKNNDINLDPGQKTNMSKLDCPSSYEKLTINTTLIPHKENSIIIEIPYNEFDKNYNSACTIINRLSEDLEGSTILPTREKEMIITYNEKLKDKLGEVLKNYE